ncbi:nuclear transport factor 2 family protein [Corallococcus sp. bb12-1]|uniref:nuclear transport factor 2 family protein n=1 Tax=Corallococcus sp. bb12-1 TaxID=2996784 RepID=UPI002270EE78|nr:nuclear transport factor 2 family protein [Corallococcus sp. bb12-1]MCY1046147.1 nuclear transport factor 2 family protein [Corallococcus sp. bb12-1]
MSTLNAEGVTPSLAHQLQALTDRQALTELVGRLDLLLDAKRFDDLRSVYTEDVVADFPMSVGRVQGVDVLAGFARQRMTKFWRTQHSSTNILIELEGDRATVLANRFSVHVHQEGRPQSHLDAGIAHRFQAIRTPQGWRFSRIEAEVLWTAGEPGSH